MWELSRNCEKKKRRQTNLTHINADTLQFYD